MSNRFNSGSECAKKVRIKIEQLSSFKLEPTHQTVEGGYDEKYKDEHKFLDYHVLNESRRIAMLDVSCPNYQLLDYNARRFSRFMPVKNYKVEIMKETKMPIFIVYNMRLEEDYKLPLKSRCLWIKGKDVIKGKDDLSDQDGFPYVIKKEDEKTPFPELQENYYTNFLDWHRGLSSLIEEFEKIPNTATQLNK